MRNEPPVLVSLVTSWVSLAADEKMCLVCLTSMLSQPVNLPNEHGQPLLEPGFRPRIHQSIGCFGDFFGDRALQLQTAPTCGEGQDAMSPAVRRNCANDDRRFTPRKP